MLSIFLSFLFTWGLVSPEAPACDDCVETDSLYAAELRRIYKPQMPTISIQEYLQMDADSVVVLDAREQHEYRVSHLRYARNIGFIWFDMRDIYDIPKDKAVVVYSSIGDRSQRITEMLIRAGYRKVYNLYGGIFEWVNQGYPVYTGRDVQTSQVHIYKKDLNIWLKRGTKVL